MSLGAASVCWEDPKGAGVFDSDRAKEIGDELMDFLIPMPPFVMVQYVHE